MIFCDAHLHIIQCFNYEKNKALTNTFSVSCAHSKSEFLEMEALLSSVSKNIFPAFGLHPQKPDFGASLEENAAFLKCLLEEKRICAVGETGFDLFSPEFKLNFEKQKKAWGICLDLALKYKVPLVLHDRKALDILFSYAKELASLPAVVFHSFAFGVKEAESLLSHKINGYFSFGNALIKGNKKSLACFEKLPLDRLLLETDAPYQTLRGQTFTPVSQIEAIYKRAGEIRNLPLDALCGAMKENFFAAYKGLQNF